jgi:hypothetical protein
MKAMKQWRGGVMASKCGYFSMAKINVVNNVAAAA